MQRAGSRRSIAAVAGVLVALGPTWAADRPQDKPVHGEKRAEDEAVLEPARRGEDSPGSRKAPAAAQAGSAAASPQPSPSQQAAPPVAQGRPPPEFRGPDITLIAGEERTVYEYRQNGQLRMIKVVPKFGKPYYLAPRDPTRGWGDLEQADSLIAQWVLWEF